MGDQGVFFKIFRPEAGKMKNKDTTLFFVVDQLSFFPPLNKLLVGGWGGTNNKNFTFKKYHFWGVIAHVFFPLKYALCAWGKIILPRFHFKNCTFLEYRQFPLRSLPTGGDFLVKWRERRLLRGSFLKENLSIGENFLENVEGHRRH